MIEADGAQPTDIAGPLSGLTQVETVAPDEAARVLEERARVLARKPDAAPADEIAVVRFSRGAETFLIETRRVLAIISVPHIRRLPRARPPLYGLGVFRGELLMLADLRPDAPRGSDAGRVLVLGDDEPVAGLLVDAVAGIEQVTRSQLREPPRTEDGTITAITDDAACLIAVDVLLAHFARSHA